MRKLRINKESIKALLAAGGIVLCMGSCTRTFKEKTEPAATPSTELVTTYSGEEASTTDDENSELVTTYLDISEGGEYSPLNGHNSYTLVTGANIYYPDGTTYEQEVNDKLMVVTILERNDKYSKIQLADGRTAYVISAYLLECANFTSDEYIVAAPNIKENLLTDAFLYDDSGMYIGYVRAEQRCGILGTRGGYTNVLLDDGRTGYIVSYAISDEYNKIKGYGYVKSTIPVYSDPALTNMVSQIEGNKVVGISSFDGDVLRIVVEGKQCYIRTSDILSRCIIVDINCQRIACYIDYQLVGCWKTRTGANGSPTHVGAFDIDYKQADFYFTKYPAHAPGGWVLFNEAQEEGIHDLAGDDEQNYGNQAYQLHGSHGCVRVPREAIEFILRNYDVGDMVIVVADSHALLYNAENNTLIVIDTDTFNQSRTR